MNTRHFVALALAFASGAALAQTTIGSVVVRADSEMSLTIACNSPAKPSLKEVEQVLAIKDPTRTNGLRTKLMSAAAEACKAGEPKIQVSRSADGKSLTWKAMS